MTNAVELLRKDFYRKGVCVIADIVKTRQEKTNIKCQAIMYKKYDIRMYN